MKQGVLPFQYEQEKTSTGMTALGGLPAYLDLAHAAGLSKAVQRHVRLREGRQGWSDSQVINSLVLLNLAGGDAVDDLRVLEKDEGFCGILRRAETYGMRRREGRATERRWRTERRRTVPSPSAVFRYLAGFHDESQEDRRQAHTAFIPAANEALRGLGKVNGELVAFVQSRLPQREATLDMDACLVETEKQEALYSYKGYKAYQPLTTYWAEQDLIVRSEFRDGNVPAGHEQLRVLQEALEVAPAGVEKVLMRSDTAGYQTELLRYCAEGEDDRFGVIEFAVGVDVTPEFKGAVADVAEEDWQTLEREVEEHKIPTDQQWAEVCFVPNWIGHSKKSPDYRFIAIREPLRQVPLPGMEGQLSLPVPAVELDDKAWYKVLGVVTNRELAGDEVIWWYRQRCGKSEEAHGVMKEDLAGGKLPSGNFGVNAAWWAITVLAFNVNSVMKWLVLGKEWASKRLKAVRFAFISIPGRVVRRAGTLIIRLTRDHPSYEVLLGARRRILALAHGPP
ncbi:MAG: IS1380 family transposase [Dehalococcoidia bacterium]